MPFTKEDLARVFEEVEGESAERMLKQAQLLASTDVPEGTEEIKSAGMTGWIQDKQAAVLSEEKREELPKQASHGKEGAELPPRPVMGGKYIQVGRNTSGMLGSAGRLVTPEEFAKMQQGDIGKEASARALAARALAGGALIGGGAALTGTGALALRAAHEQKKISKGEDVNPWASKLLRVKSLPPEIQKKSPKEQAEWYQKHHMQKKGELQVGQFKFAKDMPDFEDQDRPKKVKEIYRALKREHPDMPAEEKARIAARQGKPGKQKQGPPYKGPIEKEGAGPLTATLGEKGEAIGTAAGLLAGAALGASLGKKPGGARVIDGLLGGMLGTVAGAAGGRVAGHVAEVVGRETEGGPYSMGKRREAAQRRMAGTPLADIMSKKGSAEPTFHLLEAAAEKVAAAGCSTPGAKKGSGGKGKGKAYGKGHGPMGVPKKAEFIIGGQKIAAGEGAAVEELGLSNSAADEVARDQQTSQELIGAKIPTATSEHLKQVATPPKGTDALFLERTAEEINKLGQYAPVPAYPGMQMGRNVVYYPVKEPSLSDKAQAFLAEHPESYPLLGAALGGTAGGLLGSQVDIPGATLAGTGVGAAGGAALGELAGSRSRSKRAEFIIGGEKIAAKEEKPGKVSKRDLQRTFEAQVRRSGSPVRRRFLWDVGDVVGKKKGKEEYKPGTMVQIPTYKHAAEKPLNPMMEGGDARYTVGPIPEDVAKYLRTQQMGKQIGGVAGLGAGALGGGALGHAGGEMVGSALEQAGHPMAGRAAEILATLGGGALGGLAGRGLGQAAGEAVGGAVAEQTTPASQITVPYLTPGRAEFIASRLSQAPMLEAGRTPTVAISPR